MFGFCDSTSRFVSTTMFVSICRRWSVVIYCKDQGGRPTVHACLHAFLLTYLKWWWSAGQVGSDNVMIARKIIQFSSSCVADYFFRKNSLKIRTAVASEKWRQFYESN